MMNKPIAFMILNFWTGWSLEVVLKQWNKSYLSHIVIIHTWVLDKNLLTQALADGIAQLPLLGLFD